MLEAGLGTFFSFTLSWICLCPEDEGGEDGRADVDGRSDLDIGVLLNLVVDSFTALNRGLGTFSFPLSFVLLVPDDEADEGGEYDLFNC